VWTLHRQSWSHRAIARPLGSGRMTVGRHLQAPTCPARQGRREAGKRLLPPDNARLLTRWNAGCREARRQFRDLQHQGSTGSYATGARYARRLRQAQGGRPPALRPGPTRPLVLAGQHQPLTTRRATRLVLKRPRKRPNADAPLLARLQDQPRDWAVAIALAQDFCPLVCERQADRVEHWLACAIASRVAPLPRIATGLRAACEAVKAGLRLPWSTGPVEGQLNRVKRRKRSMFGRATMALLSRRSLLTA
jgi:transposase